MTVIIEESIPPALVQRVTQTVHLIDPATLNRADITDKQFWKEAFSSIATTKQMIEFTVMDIGEDRKETIEWIKKRRWVRVSVSVLEIPSRGRWVVSVGGSRLLCPILHLSLDT